MTKKPSTNDKQSADRNSGRRTQKLKAEHCTVNAKKTIGIELPFGWCLVRGDELRKLQTDLREAQFKAELRARRLAFVYKMLFKGKKA